MSRKTTVFVVIAVALVLSGCCLCGGAASVQSTQADLLRLQQRVQNTQAQRDVALDNVSQKISGTYKILSGYLNHEEKIFKDLADARSRYDQAAQGGNLPDQISTALAFNIQVKAIVESNPQIASADLAKQTSNALEEAVNEIVQKFDDSQDSVADYNTYRGKLWAPLFVGNIMGFPRSYEFYKGSMERLDVNDLLK